MKLELTTRTGQFSVSTAWLRTCVIPCGIALLVLQSLGHMVAAKDIPAELRSFLDEEEDEEPKRAEQEKAPEPRRSSSYEDDVAEAPDRFRKSSRNRVVADSAPIRTPLSDDGPGIIGQAGHLAFKTFGRTQSITPIEAMPYILTDEHFIFSDLRGFVSNSALFGGNIGVGYRNLREDLNAWFGGSVWYDADGTTGRTYQQIGLSFEGLVDRWEFRSNVYLPFSSAQTYSSTLGNERIVGNQLLYSRYVDKGVALQGVDFEAGYNLPVMEKHQLRGFVGYYHFSGGPSGGINGFKTRVEGVINNSVTAQVLYTNDKLFGNNVMVGCSILFPWGASHPTSKWKQSTPSPFRFVERNYNVIVDRNTTVDDNLVAFNPLTHAAYKIEQVNSNAGTSGNGTAANPFNTVSAAQGAGADVILVQGGSVLNTSVILSNGQHLIGDGSHQALKLDGGGVVYIPTQVAGGATPQFSGVNGPAVTMATNSEFSGFIVKNNNGNGVVGSNVAGATIRDVSFQNITGDAVRFTNSSGNFVLDNLTINQTTASGITFVGGTPNLSLSASISGTQNDGILLSNLSGGPIQIDNTTINQTGGSGLRLNNVAADVTVTGLTTKQTSGSGVSITGGTASNTYRFGYTTTINQPNGVGLNVNNTTAAVTIDNLVVNSTAGSPAVSLTNSTGKITLSNVTANTTNAIGLYGRGLTSLVVSNGTLTTANAGAVDVQNSTINVNLSQVNTDTGPFGIRLINNTGSFNVTGAGVLGSGGTIKNTVAGVILTSTGSVAISNLDLTTNGVGVQSTGNSQTNLNGLRIAGSTGYAVDSLNDAILMIQNSTMTNNGTIGGGTIRAQVNTVATYQWLVQGNTITDHNGTPILFTTQTGGNGASLGTTINQNVINADRSGMTLVNLNWYGPLSASISNNSLNAGGASMTGVAVVDNSATDSAVARITNNAATFSSNNGTGILASAVAGSTFQVDNNGVDFKGVNGTGLRFNLGGVSSTWIYSNVVTDEAGGATGMLFDTVAASSRLQIEANTVNLLSTDLTVHRGIIFTTVTPTIQLNGNYNNVISNTSTPFLMPVNSSTGHIIVNGVLVP